ncbi:hypothetical protein ILUMI_07671 [Ignelater luminosus]|uniref:Short-chain dehydrogenase/reductase 3 n=1 Tax=Ignelater luminosus TaxID=2038154 RepID=A0A8K0GBD7_IGNLU|nr:hypothetical protein ILUMI_07671 [Ignelater luminosus]
MATLRNSSTSNNEIHTQPKLPNDNENLWKQVSDISQVIGEVILFLLKFWFLVGQAFVRLFIPIPPKSVKGEIVLITGAGNGIGRELAFQYASQGATVVGWDINEKGNLETVAEIAKLGYPKAYAYVCNVAKREEVMEVAKKVQKDVGDVTILINNAGIMPCHPFFDHTTEEIHRIMDINVMAHFWTLQAFLPAMVQNNHGHIVAISSVAGLMGVKNLTPYCASKFAVRGMMEALYQDLHTDQKCQIKTTCIYPFAVHTGLFDVKNANMKYPKLTPVLKPKDVAKNIMNAQRRDVFETTIPRHMLSVSYCMKLFPVKALMALNEFFDSYIETDL